jgi:hypothetical protein
MPAMTTRRLLCGLLLVGLLAAVGCTGMGRFDLDVTMDHRAFQAELGTVPSVEVNFIGVNRTEYAVWYSYSINKYWLPENSQRVTAVRQGETAVATFSEHPPYNVVISRTNKFWDRWRKKGAIYLIALCNYPRTSKDEPGEADPRRVILPLSKQRWSGYFWGRRRIRFQVTPRGIDCLTPPLPPPKPRSSR